MRGIAVHSPGLRDATSFYRAWGPWSALTKELNVSYLEGRTINWSDVAPVDVMFLHRPFSETHLQMASYAKRAGKKVWIDFDDDLFNVHHSNKNFHRYDGDAQKKLLRKIITQADHVSVSTAHLKTIYGPIAHKDITVIENAIPNNVATKLLATEPAKPRKMIAWRGTDHHELNLHFYGGAIKKIMQDYPAWCWCFMGFRPWYLMEAGNPGQSCHMGEPDILDYFYKLRDYSAAIQVVPLVDNTFNRSKSSIAYMEAAAFGGSLVIAPDMPEWNKHQGIVVYEPNNQKSFLEAMGRVLDMGDKNRALFQKQARKHVLENCTLEKQNAKRLAILDDLLG